MGLPGGGRSLPSMRLLRHFNLVHIPELSRQTMKRIFTKILEWGLESHNASWRKQIVTITDLTLDCYQRAIKTLLPVPAKSHYLFNLRQVSEIIQGMLSVSAATVDKQQDKLSMLKKLWVHECMRVFADRLINDEDKQLFITECLNPKSESKSFIDFDKIGDPEKIIFNNFVVFKPEEPVY
jgi:dynein heavy chain